MIKQLSLCSLLLLSTSLLRAACANKVDPSKVVLFVDTNYSDLEIKHAEIAACKRGERLQVVPKNYKEYSGLILKKEENNKARWDCEAVANADCSKQRQLAYDSEDNLSNFKAQQKPISDQLKDALTEIKTKKGKIKSFAISGHNGGGHFAGAKGSLGRYEIAAMVSEVPEINDVTSILLLGCYTGVKAEVSNWKGIFPHASLIAGYDGSAPAYSRPQGHQYIEDILVKEKILTSLKDVKKINASAKGLIRSLGGLNSAVYLKTMCKEDEEGFYYSSMGGRTFDQLKLSECEKAIAEVKLLYPNFLHYESGEIEPPKDTVNGELRKIYNKVRANEHCLKSDYTLGGINAHNVFNMLFMEGVKKNFAHYYQDELKEVEEIIASINPDNIIKTQEEELKRIDSDLKESQKLLEEFKKDPEAFIAKESSDMMKLTSELDALTSDPKNKAFLDKIRQNSFINTPMSPEELVLYNKYQTMNFAIQIKSQEITFAKRDPTGFQHSLVMGIEWKESSQTRRMLNLDNMKKNPGLMKDIWIPNSANLATKSRKELMTNLHKMDDLTFMGGLTPKQTAALGWIKTTTSKHLVYYQNPFDWHDYQGKPEAIPDRIKLQDHIKSSEQGIGGGSVGGYMSGVGYGYGSGYVPAGSSNGGAFTNGAGFW